MKKSLFTKLVATFTVIISVSFIIIAAFLSYWFQGYYFDQRKKQLSSEGQYIVRAMSAYSQGTTSKQQVKLTTQYISNYLSANIWITDSYGYVDTVSNPKHKSLEGIQVLTKDLEKLRKGESVENSGESYDKRWFDSPVHTFEIPIFKGNTFVGAIVMHTPRSEITAPLKRVYNIIWISAIFAIIISSIVIYYFSERIIIRPLSKINNVADKISKGEVDKRVVMYSNDEIGELANSFNSIFKGSLSI